MASTIDLAADSLSLDPSRTNGRVSNLPPALDTSRSLASSPFWHRSAPRRVVTAQLPSSPEKAWTEWQRHLSGRKSAAMPGALAGRPSPLVWGLSAKLANQTAHRLDELRIALTSSEIAQSFVSEWMDHQKGGRPQVGEALEATALAHALPRLAITCSDSLWWNLCDTLFALAMDAQQWTPDWENDPASVAAHQLLAGELALTLSFHFREVMPLRAARKAAYAAFSDGLVELLDGEGLLRSSYLPWWRPLLACWTRAAMMSKKLRKPAWSAEAQTQYEWLVRQSVAFSRPDGSLVLSDDQSREWSPELFRAALELAGDDSDYAATEMLLSGRVVPHDADFDEDDLPEPSVNSEWSGLALMATNWSKAAVRLGVSYSSDSMQFEVAVGRDMLWHGSWDFELVCDGRRLTIDDDEWEELCWQSDEDCDFLELAVDLEGGIRLERQLLLAREDAVLYLADYFHSDDEQDHDFEYRMHLPLCAPVHFAPEPETRDGRLVANHKPLAVVLPLALPEWRSDPRGGELVSDGRRLKLEQRQRGKRMACPLFFDFRQRRLLKERTWRRLTIAEMLEIQPPDVAVGYRAQSGKDQWLFYRSLAPAANRTLLGQNTAAEFFAGRFLPTGEVDEFVEIETIEE